MGTIVAIGGGDSTALETLDIDRRIVELTGKHNPKALFIPTASGDSEGYQEAIRQVYGQRLGCNVDSLCLLTDRPTLSEIEDKIASCDLVYVGGGNTMRMMKLWRKLGVDKLLTQAYERGTVMSGLSAGAICWFRCGHSDSRKSQNPDFPFIRIKALGLLPWTFCPHFHSNGRNDDFLEMIARNGGLGIGVDDCCAIEFRHGRYSVLSAKSEARAYRLYKQRGEVINEVMENEGAVVDLLH